MYVCIKTTGNHEAENSALQDGNVDWILRNLAFAYG